jgi:transposase
LIVSEAASSPAELLERIARLEATISTQNTVIAERDEQLRRFAAERSLITLRIQKLELQIARFNRKVHGRSSEKLGQLLLELEDLEADLASGPAPDLLFDQAPRPEREPPVRALSPGLPRKRIVREPAGNGCPGCGGALRPMGDDTDEVLDLVAQVWQVLQTVRPKYSCRACETIVQAPAPPKVVARGKMSFATLAHVAMSKWGYHLPFYRQAQMMAAKGVEIERSTLARSAGYAATLLDPIYNRIREHGRKRFKIHTDDTRLPILAPTTGKTHKGALWTYAVDDRNSGSSEPPLIWYRATMGRAGENVMTELGDFTGVLQADGFTGYNQIYRGAKVREAACLAHLRRKIFDVHEAEPTELSTAAMAGIQAIYRIEDEIRGLPPAERLMARKTRTRPLARALRRHLARLAHGLSHHTEIAKAFAYGTKRWRAFNRFLYDGRLEPDNLIAERAIRGFTVGRRNWLFAGSFKAAERAAVILSIIETCKANNIDAEAYMADVMERIQNDWPASRWDELMPWNWRPLDNRDISLAA